MLVAALTVSGCIATSIVGVVNDTNCGSKHFTASASAASCVASCVNRGIKYLLVSHGKVYQVSPQRQLPCIRTAIGGSSWKCRWVWVGHMRTQTDRFNAVAAPRKQKTRWSGWATVYLRVALGLGFLSAVGDRFGAWGAPGAPLVAWGNFHNFLVYAAKLNPWFPASWSPVVGWIATVCEIVLGIGLIAGFRTRIIAFLSGWLTLAFALGMTFGLGVKAPFNYSVFAASAGSFLLGCMDAYPWSLDALWDRKDHRPAVPAPRSKGRPGPP